MNSRWKVFGVLLLLCSCASTRTYEEAAKDLGHDLLTQVEARKDLRDIRLFVDAFQPCERDPGGGMMPMSSTMAASHEMSSRRLRHVIMGVLAPKVSVLETDSIVTRKGTKQDGLFERAETVEASAILVGNYTMEGEDLLVMLRVVDAHDRIVLAASEGLVPHGIVRDVVPKSSESNR